MLFFTMDSRCRTKPTNMDTIIFSSNSYNFFNSSHIEFLHRPVMLRNYGEPRAARSNKHQQVQPITQSEDIDSSFTHKPTQQNTAHSAGSLTLWIKGKNHSSTGASDGLQVKSRSNHRSNEQRACQGRRSLQHRLTRWPIGAKHRINDVSNAMQCQDKALSPVLPMPIRVMHRIFRWSPHQTIRTQRLLLSVV